MLHHQPPSFPSILVVLSKRHQVGSDTRKGEKEKKKFLYIIPLAPSRSHQYNPRSSPPKQLKEQTLLSSLYSTWTPFPSNTGVMTGRSFALALHNSMLVGKRIPLADKRWRNFRICSRRLGWVWENAWWQSLRRVQRTELQLILRTINGNGQHQQHLYGTAGWFDAPDNPEAEW